MDEVEQGRRPIGALDRKFARKNKLSRKFARKKATNTIAGRRKMNEEEQYIDSEPVEEGLTLETFTRFFHEILDQPPWRSEADREMDYKDGNQLSSDLLTKMSELGIPPAIEPLIGPAIESILGAEAKKRTDWRVIPDGDKEGQEVADALNYKLNQAERHSRADRSCSDAYEGQVSVGLGWVEVSRSQDPFKYQIGRAHV